MHSLDGYDRARISETVGEAELTKIIDEDEDIEITITYKIAEVLKKGDLDARHAEPQ